MFITFLFLCAGESEDDDLNDLLDALEDGRDSGKVRQI